MKNNIRLGLGILTVLATPFAVDAATGSNEAHAAQDTVKSAQVAKTTNKEEVKTTTQKQVESATKTEATKVETTIKENTKVEDTKKDASSDKQASSVKTVSGKPQAPEDDSTEKKSGWTSNGTYYVNGKLANWWYDDGKDWYFFQNGKKHTGEGKDNAGAHYFVNGKYATGEYNGKIYVEGKETTPVKDGYKNGVFFADGKLANWWYDDGTAWYFFQNGKKHTGEGKDNAGYHYFVNGKYGTGEYNGKVYIEGKEITPIKNGYKNGFFFVDSKLANWWHDDGKDWYFFKNGKKYTGVANDSVGTHRFVNGKYDNNVPAINMPQYYQSDARWGRKVYGIANMTTAGCVPTALAMAFSGLGKPVTPVNVADVIYYNTKEFNVSMIGTSGAGADYAIKHYNFKNTVINSKAQLVQALQSGNPVFALVGNGDFVRGYAYTHGIMLSGYQNGKTKAMDPASAYNTNKWYNVDSIWNQRSTDPYDTMLGGSFMLIEKK